ncbi:NYN domain-containing protein [Roseivirga spongicola]|uniref:Cold-shock protein n=1 Tax=Roseivirga spongicola TaxID=333140 RepID=A0A150X3M0_9BACT|nr:NYN domain-containing protein [Roseivirga spongicola]KYG73319.1 cold-shock protein [Roseivirga spongicola]WPZ10068.1 NYN domain-containing protein [Roseivirga spongicola]
MNTDKNNKLTRIGVFYDGNYFLHVSNYYAYVHKRKARISVSGLHDYIRHKVAEVEGDSSGYRHCQIVDSHYFRGRLNAKDASEKSNSLYYDRLFDDVLMKEGITTHYLPVKTSQSGQKHEKGIDVWLALEAFELAYYKRFNVLVLVASDGDYTPLIRKLNTLGTRVMLMSWDFDYTDDYGNERVTRTSQDLLEVVTYPIAMHEEIDNRVARDSFAVNNLFLPQQKKVERKAKAIPSTHKSEVDSNNDSEGDIGEIMNIQNGYGFIKRPPNNLFFHYQSVNGIDFNDLSVGDKVTYNIQKNDKGDDVAVDVEPIE